MKQRQLSIKILHIVVVVFLSFFFLFRCCSYYKYSRSIFLATILWLMHGNVMFRNYYIDKFQIKYHKTGRLAAIHSSKSFRVTYRKKVNRIMSIQIKSNHIKSVRHASIWRRQRNAPERKIKRKREKVWERET